MMRMASQPDERYFFGVADRTEPSGGQGFQYNRLVRSILYEAGSDNTILSAPITGITSASVARTAGSEIAPTASSGFVFSFGGTDALTSVREVAGKPGATTHASCTTSSSSLGRFLSGAGSLPAFFCLLSRACLHRSSFFLFSSSLQTRMAATLRSLLNSWIGLRKASLLDGSSM